MSSVVFKCDKCKGLKNINELNFYRTGQACISSEDCNETRKEILIEKLENIVEDLKEMSNEVEEKCRFVKSYKILSHEIGLIKNNENFNPIK